MNGDAEKGIGERPGFSAADIQAARERMKAEHPEQFPPQNIAQTQAEIDKQVQSSKEVVGETVPFVKNPNAPISGQEAPVQFIDASKLQAQAQQEQGRLATLKNRITELIRRKQ